ncbi:metalloregulator ArsR/SmtB family transcription factor [Halieaceae bacterium IMCC8485]|uniref:Metalloregulator ArsR/SmtB family transcription factor n=2 Tax=Candidatus Seongchinamella marina TaxID=2518990 RepID=A0ABT3T0P7_9GAMM|nr:metalloregulator ArsR/SmtB family transcription factor [Candidatus Seongchinamella marina]
MGTFKKDLFTQFAQVAKAVANANRLEILEFLAQGEYSVEDLSKVMGLTVANTSHHLQQLRHGGLVTTRKEAQRVYYRITGDDVIDLMGNLRGVAERHLNEVDHLVNTFLTSKDSMEPVAREELLRRVKEGSTMVLDVRPPAEYAAGHLPGAVNIPLAELKKNLAVLDLTQDVVAYCRGPYCILAFEAVKLLRDKGFQVRRLQDGYPEWKNAGLPVEIRNEH